MNHYPSNKILLRVIAIPILIFTIYSCNELYYQSAFVSDRDGNLDLFLSLNNGEYLNLTNDKDAEYGLSWSPDGHSLVYAKQINKQYDLFLLDLKTKESKQLTSDTVNQYGPSFSPDGSLVGFVSNMDSKLNEIYTLNLKSGEIVRITNNDLMDSSPTFHPDKQHIYYVTFMDRDSLNRITNGELFVTDLNGSFHKRITNQPGNDGNPTPGIPATGFTPAVPPTYGPDPADVLILKLEIVQGQNKITAPFVFAGDNVQVPIYVTWGPAVANRGTLNGVEFTDFKQLVNKVVATIEKKDPIDLRLYGDWSTAAIPLVQLINKSPLERTEQIFPGSMPGSIEIFVPTVGFIVVSTPALIALAALVLAIGSLILLAGASAFLVCLGIAVVLAVANGYVNIEASQTTTTDSQGNPTNETRIVLSQQS